MSWIPDGVIRHLREVAGWPELPGNRYTVVRPIGRGGMGAVFEARDEWLQRDVAIKISNAPVPGADLEARLQQEARVLARLEHPGIVPVHDLGLLADGRLFYVMKLVHGDTLEHHAPRLESEHARVAVVERVVETAAFAHAAGVVHRDLKPSNVMVGRFGEVLVLDWGVARLMQRSTDPAAPLSAAFDAAPPLAVHDARATDPGTRLGTPGFMSPEQASGDRDSVGPASDIYALGALLFWLWMREPPPSTSPPETRARLLACRPAPSKRLAAIVMRCLEPKPDSRYADAAALLDEIGRLRAGLPIAALPETVFDRAWRFVSTYRTFILLIAAYLLMRTVIAFLGR